MSVSFFVLPIVSCFPPLSFKVSFPGGRRGTSPATWSTSGAFSTVLFSVSRSHSLSSLSLSVGWFIHKEKELARASPFEVQLYPHIGVDAVANAWDDLTYAHYRPYCLAGYRGRESGSYKILGTIELLEKYALVVSIASQAERALAESPQRHL